MARIKRIGGSELARRMRERAAAALRESDLREVFSADGAYEVEESAGSALKALLAEKAAEYATRAISMAQKRKMKLGAAAVIIAAEKDRW